MQGRGDARRTVSVKAVIGFLLAVALWTSLTVGWTFVFSPSTRQLTLGDVIRIVPHLLLALVGSLILLAVVSRTRTAPRAVLVGLLLGFLLPIVAGYLVMKFAGSFESPAIFSLGVLVSIPSAIGGALAAWIQFRSRTIAA